jgi:bifunctional non-homologous end joining protein LigD
VLAPARPDATSTSARAEAAAIASEIAARRPDLVELRMGAQNRVGRVLIDVRQNAVRLTTVAPYSLRATRLPRVSTPLAWVEVEEAVLHRDPARLDFSAAAIAARVRRPGDPWSALVAAGSGSAA